LNEIEIEIKVEIYTISWDFGVFIWVIENLNHDILGVDASVFIDGIVETEFGAREDFVVIVIDSVVE
jgi:hypothetical protein